MYGDPRHRSMSVIWTNVKNFISLNSTLPMLCTGDLNEIMHPTEKLGPAPVNFNRINVFCSLIKKCGLFDLGYDGPSYTWSNKRFTSTPTYERLDRCLANAEWCRAFPTTTVLHLPMMYSDHAPILLLPTSQRQRPRKPFRFENWWLMEEDFQQIAQQSWHISAHRSLSHKIRFLAADLKKWRATKPKTSDQLQSIEDQILSQQTLHPSNQNHSLLHSLNQQHQHLLAREESYHIQRFKKQWAIKGDRNTAFFHLAIIKRHRKNRISHLLNPDGSPSTTPTQISSTLLNYFQSIFSTSSPRPHTTPPNPSHQLSHSHNPHRFSQPQPSGLPNPDSTSFTYSTPDLNEIHSIIKKIRSNAAPGPDGLNAAFYKASWNWVKQDLLHLVSDFYSAAILPQDINQTFFTLIPKKPNPSIPQDFRPISLCNVIYKLIAKSLADRIQPHLPNYISQAQSAFVAGRHISSNIILTQEIIHSFTLKS
jgi:hypothetical protein